MHRLSSFMLFLVLVVVLVPCVLLATEAGEVVAGADMVSVLLSCLPASWDAWVTLIIAGCAAISAAWARPAEDANIIIRLLYTLINAIGCNVGKAQNADDAAAK